MAHLHSDVWGHFKKRKRQLCVAAVRKSWRFVGEQLPNLRDYLTRTYPLKYAPELVTWLLMNQR